jgi:hypothetical protein
MDSEIKKIRNEVANNNMNMEQRNENVYKKIGIL